MSILSQEVCNILSRLPSGVDSDMLRYGISVEELPVECITLQPAPEPMSNDDFFFKVATDGIVVEFLNSRLVEVCHG